MNDKIKRLQNEIEAEKKKISNCKHDFNKPFYNPETVRVGYGSIQDGKGSDPHWSYEGYRNVKKDRWTRSCKICEHVQHTYAQEPIINDYKPYF